MNYSPWAWVGFVVFILATVALDLGLFRRKTHAVKLREALGATALWVTLAAAFGLFIRQWLGPDKALEFYTGYLVEESLSIDNLFLFLVIFSYFKVPAAFQHKVLTWGILGALAMRLTLIVVGAALVRRFAWVLLIFGAFLVFTGIRMAFGAGEEQDPGHNPLVRFLRKHMRFTHDFHGDNFFVRADGKLRPTPLFMVLMVVEGTDLVFALDSIPAIFGITTDSFIIFTSNVFAILGLRSLYFALAGMMGLFHFLKYGLAAILTFVGGKLLVTHFDVHVPTVLTLGVIATALGVSIGCSLIWAEKKSS